jgi:membrane protease YdiL (CAAX protease family)
LDTDLTNKSGSNFLNRYALIVFFALAFAISWLLPAFFPLGPFVAAFLVAALTGGLKDLISRCLRWRVGLRWYAAALFVPAAIGLITVALNLLLGAPVPSAAQLGPWYSLFLLFPVALVDAPLFEETGWRGFAMPRFSPKRSNLANTLILGVLIAAWHIPRALADPTITAPYLLAAMGSAVLTNWVFYNARGSALLAIIYHTSANTLGLYFSPMFTGPDHVRYFWLLAAVNVLFAILIVLVTGTDLRRHPATDEAMPTDQPRPLK